jgi:radical SAM protein with 4Fe4S-binding SPASM domain
VNNYTKFITSKGLEFYYRNDTNSLHEKNGDRIVVGNPSLRDDSSYYEFAKTNYATRKKHNKPVALRILMGHACNYSCTYCMQKDIGNPDERPKREALKIFFDSINENLNLDDLNRIELWGGEPFLYWQDVMELMKFFDSEGRHFYISTNGSTLHPKHAEFFSTLKSDVLVSISHDAMHQQELRGDDIFHRDRVIKTLKMFDDLNNVEYGFTCSVTNTNYDLFEIDKYFRNKIIENDLSTFQISFSLGRTYANNSDNRTESLPCTLIEGGANTGEGNSYNHVIHGENLEKFRVILKNFLEAHHKQLTERGINKNGQPVVFQTPVDELALLNTDIYESHLGYSVTQYARKTITGEPILEATNCGADMADILSIDLDGNVRTCPHTDEDHIFGHVNNIKGIRIISLDMKRKQSHCASCHNIKICRSSCPIKLPDEVFMTNCRVEKIWYGEIQKAAFRLLFNDTVEMVETGIDLPYHETFKQSIINGV